MSDDGGRVASVEDQWIDTSHCGETTVVVSNATVEVGDGHAAGGKTISDGAVGYSDHLLSLWLG